MIEKHDPTNEAVMAFWHEEAGVDPEAFLNQIRIDLPKPPNSRKGDGTLTQMRRTMEHDSVRFLGDLPRNTL